MTATHKDNFHNYNENVNNPSGQKHNMMSMLVKICLLLQFGLHSGWALESEVCFTLNGQHQFLCTERHRYDYDTCVSGYHQYIYYLADTPESVTVPLTECQQNEYAILESLEYSIPKSIQDYSSSTEYSHYCPDKTRNEFNTCYQNRCQCCTKPTAVCTQIFKLTDVPDYQDFCKTQNLPGRCNFYPQRYNFNDSSNKTCLDYCGAGGRNQWCYARWVTVKYHCESGAPGPTEANPRGVNIGLIVGAVIGVIVVCLVVLLLVIFLIHRRKKSKKPLPKRASATFNNNVYNNSTSVTLATSPSSGATAITIASSEYARVDTSRNNKNNKAAMGGEDVDDYENIPADKPGLNGLVDNPNYEGAPRKKDDYSMKTGVGANRNNGYQNDMTKNNYYESQNLTSNQPIGNDMTENTYYESQDVKKDQPMGDKLTENNYFDSGDVVAPNKGTKDLKGHQPSGSQLETSFKHDGNHHNSHDKNETGTYVYTYGHFKLEGRKRQDKQ